MGLPPNSLLDFKLPAMGDDPLAKQILAAMNTPGAPDASALIIEALVQMSQKLDALTEKAFVVTSPFVEMPPDGIPFNELGWATIGAKGGAPALVVQFVVPMGNNGVIRCLGNEYLGAEFVEGTGNVQWQIWADGEPITNFQNILGSLGSPSSPSETAPLRIYEQQTISFVMYNVGIAAAGQLLGARLSGWYYPTAYDEKRPITEEAEDE